MAAQIFTTAAVVLALWPGLNRQGNEFQRQGRWREAADAYTRALRFAPEAPGIQATLRNNLGAALLRAGHAEAASRELTSALALWRRTEPPQPREQMRTLSNLAACETFRGQPLRAIEFLKAALAEGALEERGPVLAALAGAAINADLDQEARHWLNEALEWRATRGLSAADDAALATVRCGLEGGAACREALERAERRYGPAHPSLAIPLQRQALFDLREERLEAAAAGLLRAALIQRESLGRESLPYARSLQLLAIVRMRQNRLPQALAHLEQAGPLLARHLTPASNERMQTIELRADILRRQGDLPAAEAALRELIAVQRASGARAETFNTLGVVLFERKQWPAAAAEFRRAAELRRAAGQGGTAAQAETLQNLALTLLESGDAGDAVTTQEESLRVREAASGPRHSSLSTGLRVYAEGLERTGRKKEARQARDRAAQVAAQNPAAGARPGVISLEDLRKALR